MMKPAILSFVLMAGLCANALSAEWSKLAYPTAEDASFVITVPDDWEIKQAEDVGDYVHLSGPTGAVFSFRTIKGTESSLNEAIEATVDEVSEKFKDAKFGEPADWTPGGLTGMYLTGTAKEKEDGAGVSISMGWCALNDGKIAEFWFVADIGDDTGISTAEKIANSLKSP